MNISRAPDYRARAEIKNSLDPVNPKNCLRPSEVLSLRKAAAARIISQIEQLGTDCVKPEDRDTYADLLKVARRAIKNADSILEYAHCEIHRAIEREIEAKGV